jgi:F0F1-type ATP synthase assembly protein I
MSLMSPSPRKKSGGKYTSAGLYITVPTLMAASILIGFFGGQWADDYFGTEPYLMLVGLALGFGAAVREVYFLVKKAQAMQEEEDNS